MLSTSPTLLARLREPNQPEIWARFVRLYTPLLLVWARRQNFQDADAADLVQDVLVKLFQVLPTYEQGEGQSFRGWLRRITTNQCQDYRRRKATRPLPTDAGMATAIEPPVIDLEEAEYRRLLVQRTLVLVRDDFSSQTWSAFMAVRVEGRSTREVAAELGISENAVYMACHRVLTRLREELGGMLD